MGDKLLLSAQNFSIHKYFQISLWLATSGVKFVERYNIKQVKSLQLIVSIICHP